MCSCVCYLGCVHTCGCVCIYPSVPPSVCLSVCLSVTCLYLSVHVSVCRFLRKGRYISLLKWQQLFVNFIQHGYQPFMKYKLNCGDPLLYFQNASGWHSWSVVGCGCGLALFPGGIVLLVLGVSHVLGITKYLLTILYRTDFVYTACPLCVGKVQSSLLFL